MKQVSYDNTDEKYMACTELNGHWFKADNVRVYNEFKALVQDGPGWDFIKEYDSKKDGRAAVRALLRQNESAHGINARKNNAYASIAQLSYSGPSRSWTFEQYVQGHLHVHNELKYCKEPVHESKKIRDFLEGIHDARLENAKDVITGDPDRYDTFEKAQSYLTLVHSNKKSKARGGIRAISQLGVGKGKTTSNKTGAGRDKNGKLKISAGVSYSREEWWNELTEAQREKVKQLRKSQHKKRKAAAVTTTETEENSSDETSKNAGSQFGRNARKGKKQKQNAEE